MSSLKVIDSVNQYTKNVIAGYCHKNCESHIPFDIIHLVIIYCYIAEEFDTQNQVKMG